MHKSFVLKNRVHTGHINFVLPTLHRALGQYLRHHPEFKVGITGKPNRLARRHARDGWKEMVLIYSATSDSYGQYAEYMLVKNSFLKKYPKQCLNRAGGGAGVRTRHRRYYIYILFP
ncbi:hypothetical protein KA005_52660 [bacterium]|nr:hypothetical protein [bacterium]